MGSYAVLGLEEFVGELFDLDLLLAQRFSQAVDELQLLRRLGQRVLLLNQGTFQALLGVRQPAQTKTLTFYGHSVFLQ